MKLSNKLIIAAMIIVIVVIGYLFSRATPSSQLLYYEAGGDDDTIGTAMRTEIYYSVDSAQLVNSYQSCPTIPGPTPAPYGTTQSFIATGLPNKTILYWALVSVDSAGNRSRLSNIYKNRTADNTNPAPPKNLRGAP